MSDGRSPHQIRISKAMKMVWKRRKREQPEQAIQRAVFDHLTWRGAKGIFAFHVPNGGWRKPVEAAIFKGLGVMPGVPDVIVIHEGRVYALELKAAKGRLEASQIAAQQALQSAGVTVDTVYGLAAAIQRLEAWGLLAGSAALGNTNPAPLHPVAGSARADNAPSVRRGRDLAEAQS